MCQHGVGLFVRPHDIRISTILQTLSIASYFARKTGGRVTFNHAPREADAQRLLNFTALTVDQASVARTLTEQPSHRIPISARTAMNVGNLNYQQALHENGPSLAEVASLVGIRLADKSNSSIEEQSGEESSSLDSIERPFIMDVKVERRQTSARSRPSASNLDPDSYERLLSIMNKFGGFSGKIKILRYDDH